MVSPLEMYYEKRNYALNLYASKLSELGISAPGFSAALSAETAKTEAAQVSPEQTGAAQTGAEQAAAAQIAGIWSGNGYDAYIEVNALNRTAVALPGYGTGINATGAQAAISLAQSGEYDGIIAEASQKYGVPVSLIKAVIQKESSFNGYSVSAAGAQGLMQLMPGTAAELGVTDPFDAAQNVDAGVRYLRRQLDRFGDVRLALAAYNYGPARVEGLGVANANDLQEYNKLPSHLQTYIERILNCEKQFASAGN